MDKRRSKAFYKPIASKLLARQRFHLGALREKYLDQLKAGSSPEAAAWLDDLLNDHYALMGVVAAAADIDNPAKKTHKAGWMTPSLKLQIVNIALDHKALHRPDDRATYVLKTLEAWAEGEDEHGKDGLVDAELLLVLQGGLYEDSLRKAVKRVLKEAGI